MYGLPGRLVTGVSAVRRGGAMSCLGSCGGVSLMRREAKSLSAVEERNCVVSSWTSGVVVAGGIVESCAVG